MFRRAIIKIGKEMMKQMMMKNKKLKMLHLLDQLVKE
jgi:hypothetical protein